MLQLFYLAPVSSLVSEGTKSFFFYYNQDETSPGAYPTYKVCSPLREGNWTGLVQLALDKPMFLISTCRPL